MAKRTSKGRFERGHSGNPAGGAILPPEIRLARKLDKVAYEKAVHKISNMTFEEIQTFLEAKKHADGLQGTVLELAIASIWWQSIKKGDDKRLESFMDRIVGPVTRKLELSGDSIADLMLQAAEDERKADERYRAESSSSQAAQDPDPHPENHKDEDVAQGPENQTDT